MKTVITILWGTILSLSITAQTQTVVDTYGTKTNQKENSRLNMALHAVFDGRNQPQTSFLIKAATHPTKEMESEVFVYFSGDDLKMFGKFDQFDISIYKASAHLGSTGERWAYLRGLSIPDRMRWWKIRIAEAIATEELSPEAVENLLDIAAAITPTTLRQTPDLIALSRAEGVAEREV